MIRLYQRKLDPSRALTSLIDVPCPEGLAYDPYQKAVVEYARSRKDVVVADAPGVGKTIEAIACVNDDPNARKILVICPGYLKGNWRDELLKWDIKNLTVGVTKGQKGELPETDIVVINYDILKGYREKLRSINWDFIIVDEVHKLKNKKADRTREVFGGIKRDSSTKRITDRVVPIHATRRLFLTGTWSPNGKPKELWSVIQQLDPTGLGSDWFYFAKRYCGLQEIKDGNTRIGWWWDGAERLNELQSILRDRFMIRRLKEEVLTQLPPKRRSIIPVESNAKLAKQLREELESFEQYAKNREDAYLENPSFSEFSSRLKENGLTMIEPTVEVVQSALEETDKIVVMCYHNEVADQIAKQFPGCILINGWVAADKRHDLVVKYQTEPKIPVLVGTMGSVGEGETMHASDLMIFPERSWVPGQVTQAEDRIHRRGQTRNARYKHLVREGSVAERQVHALVKKQESTDQMLDRKI